MGKTIVYCDEIAVFDETEFKNILESGKPLSSGYEKRGGRREAPTAPEPSVPPPAKKVDNTN